MLLKFLLNTFLNSEISSIELNRLDRLNSAVVPATWYLTVIVLR